ncbi:MAG: hypothetical protein AAGC95_14990 [Pseudomonadota bacterium]
MPGDELTAKAQVLVRGPRDKVFDAFADPGMMSRFWFKRKDQRHTL